MNKRDENNEWRNKLANNAFNEKVHALLFGHFGWSGVLNAILIYAFDFDLNSTFMAFIPPIGASLDAGSRFAVQNNSVPLPKTSWLFSRKALIPEAIIGSIANLITVPYLLSLYSGFSAQQMLLIVLGSFLFQVLIGSLVTRWFFALGAKGEIKRQMKRQGKLSN